MTQPVQSLMILIAGPYRSGTGDDPAKMAANAKAMEAFALSLFRAGHIPVVGEWFAFPLDEDSRYGSPAGFLGRDQPAYAHP